MNGAPAAAQRTRSGRLSPDANVDNGGARMSASWRRAALAAVVLAYGTAAGTAMLRTSATFDEIVMMAPGARGYATGAWNMAPEHPPMTQFLYGLPLYLAGPRYPDESGFTPEQRAHVGYRYGYAQIMLWGSGNDGTLLVRLGRLPAVLCGMLLIIVVWAVTRRAAGEGAALLAALLTAALPDLLGHGGVAYNDVPLALTFLTAVWAGDAAVREPGWRRGLLAGALVGVALGVKNSAVALGPVGLLLLIIEAYRRRGDAAWRRALPKLLLSAMAGVYLTLVLIYRMDFSLSEYRYGIGFLLRDVSGTRPTYLLGEKWLGGTPVFFPIVFLFKTSAAFQGLLLVGAVGLVVAVRRIPAGQRIERVLASHLRAPLIALLVFGVLLLRSTLNIGFRHALPVLPLLCLLAAAGVMKVLPLVHRRGRVAIAVLVAWTVLHVASYYPHFLGYLSEYGPGREEGYRVVVDSSTDWGQGLIELREFMRVHGIPRIYLSYFGSAWPAGYGIDYVPLPSFLPLPPASLPDTARPPTWVAISATNLAGMYLQSDPFRQFRDARPERVLAHSIYVYRLGETRRD
jgi:hypothetical protein